VETRSKGGLIGWNGLQYLPETEEVEVGFLLSRAHWGKGLATEGAAASLGYGFERLELESIVGIVHPENAASQRVLEKLGMSRQGAAEYFGMEVYRYVIDASAYGAGIA
jgi:ribosomal-protein-alanine N-acetyltransferase